jgi:anti-sigma28 factor (negative regulator of flagellin synthesis)
MNSDQINSLGYHTADWRTQLGRKSPTASAQSSVDNDSDGPQDRVELSAASERASESSVSSATDQRIRDIRAQIAAGTYLTPDKIDVAAERLHEQIFGQ